VVPETLAAASPWLLLLLAALAVGLGVAAVSRASRRAQAVYRGRRVLRGYEAPELAPRQDLHTPRRTWRRRVLR
jgi:hypothetical protein